MLIIVKVLNNTPHQIQIMNNEILSEISIFISTVFFALTAILIKLVGNKFSPFFVSFFRFAFGIFLVIAAISLFRKSFKIHDKRAWVLRGITGAVAMILYYAAIQQTSSGRATLLTYTYPAFVALYSLLFFKEHISKSTVASLIISTIGIILVFYDGTSYPFFGNALGLISAAFSGLAIHYIKKLRANNNPMIIYLAACVSGLVISSFSFKEAINLAVPVAVLLVGASVSVFLGQMLMSYGYKHVSATRGSIISLVTVPLTIISSYFIGEEMTFRFFIGTGLIIIGLLLNKKPIRQAP
jgi:drug/metabolite transporter (DMT)-like permease